jgi:hypothetical protein
MLRWRLIAGPFASSVENSTRFEESDHYSIFGVSIGKRRVFGPVIRKREPRGGWTYRRMTPKEEADYVSRDAW